MQNLEGKFVQEKKSEVIKIPKAEIVLDQPRQEESADIFKQTENIQRKISDENKIEEVREQLGLENKNEQIQSFISELPNKDGFIDFSQFKKIGQGGTHDVYIYPGNTGFVIKLNRAVLEKTSGLGQGELSPEMRKMADQFVEGENFKNEQLYKSFGRGHCLSEKVLIQKISIEQDGIIKNIEGVISIQEASEIFKDQNKKDFSTTYAEQDSSVEINKETYDKMNRQLLGNEIFNEGDFLKFNEKLKPIFQLIENDKKFAESIKEFLLRFKDYFEESGRFIDLVGQENVLFSKQNEKWVFKLGSVIKAETKQKMEDALNKLEEDSDIFNSDQRLSNQLMNYLALSRLLNATGLKVGIGKIIDMQLTDRQLENLNKLKFKGETK
ncbi:MAG: hypothetical protein WCJ74_00770 [bacterium]